MDVSNRMFEPICLNPIFRIVQSDEKLNIRIDPEYYSTRIQIYKYSKMPIPSVSQTLQNLFTICYNTYILTYLAHLIARLTSGKLRHLHEVYKFPSLQGVLCSNL